LARYPLLASRAPPFSLECRATCLQERFTQQLGLVDFFAALVARGLILGLSTFLVLSNNIDSTVFSPVGRATAHRLRSSLLKFEEM
jgi:hypothetical protein